MADLNTLSAVDLTTIATAITGAGEEVVGPLEQKLIAGGRSNLTYLLTDGTTKWVMRTPPRAGRTPSAHDVGREFRVTSALWDTPVPVPRPIVLGEEDLIGVPFAVAAFVEGESVQTAAELDRFSDDYLSQVSRTLIETLAALHAVDHVAVGLERFGRPDGYAQRQLSRWAGQWEIVGLEDSLALAAEVVQGLGAAVPDQQSVSIVHGDYRIDNTLMSFDGPTPEVRAVVDWELSTIGDPVADLAVVCAYRDPALDLVLAMPAAWTSPRLGSVDQMASAYESATGSSLPNWDWHLALAYFKIAVIAAGIDHRYRSGATSGDGFDRARDSVAPFLELALARVKGAH